MRGASNVVEFLLESADAPRLIKMTDNKGRTPMQARRGGVAALQRRGVGRGRFGWSGLSRSVAIGRPWARTPGPAPLHTPPTASVATCSLAHPQLFARPLAHRWQPSAAK